MVEITKLLTIVGSAKTGTTALAHHLDAHPQACLGPRKEPKFFSNMGQQVWVGPGCDVFRKSVVTDRDVYVGNFEGLRQDQWAIDASTDYLWRDETPSLLEKFSRNCDVRVICIVRDPVDRAVSEYNHTIRAKWEPLSFQESLKAEQTRFDQNWHPLFYHRRRSTLSEDVKRYADLFGDRLMILDYAELRDANMITKRLCGFLGLPEMHVEEMERRNESFIPRNAIAQTMLKSNFIRGLGRTLIPPSFRQSIRKSMVTNARDLVTVQPAERELFRELLADEIEACVRNPLVPTQNWTCV